MWMSCELHDVCCIWMSSSCCCLLCGEKNYGLTAVAVLSGPSTKLSYYCCLFQCISFFLMMIINNGKCVIICIIFMYVEGLFLIQYLETSRAPIDPVALGLQIPSVYLKL